MAKKSSPIHNTINPCTEKSIAPSVNSEDCERNGCIVGKKYMDFSDFCSTTVERNCEKRYQQNAYFTNQRLDKGEKLYRNIQVNHSIFKSMGLNSLTFCNDDFKHNIFIDCYFRSSTFENIDFTGCRFINCNLDEITLVSCNFEYVTFENCFIKYEILKPNLTDKENLRWKICKNLYIEAKRMGYFEDYRKYFFEEKKASCEHERKIAFYRSQFDKKYKSNYYEKYSTWDRISSFGKYLRYKIEKYIWGYGESLLRLLMTSIVVILLFAVLLAISKIDLLTALKVSALNFIGLNISQLSITSMLTSFQATGGGVIERVIGIIYIGLFITALYKYINRG